MQSFLDFHTHQLAVPSKEVWKNITLQQSALEILDPALLHSGEGRMTFSVGIHPWYIDAERQQEQLQTVATLLQHPNCLALGEAGLDRLSKVDFLLQQSIFIEQIHLSERYQKPIILHCVRAFPEILQLKREFKPSQAWIFHGFNQKKTILEQVQLSGCYLSVGAAVLNPLSAISKLLPNIDIGSIFLETDDKAVTIQEIYDQIMLLKGIDRDSLILAMQKNMYKIFGKRE